MQKMSKVFRNFRHVYDPEIATTTLENLGSSAIDAFKDGHQCNKYCAMLELSPISTWDRHFKWYLYILPWILLKKYFVSSKFCLYYSVFPVCVWGWAGNWRLCLMGRLQYNIKNAPISLRPGKCCLTWCGNGWSGD